MNCCERVIQTITERLDESSKLQQRIKEVDDEIIAVKIAQSKDKFQKQVCATNVKIFNNVFDIYNLYKEELDLQHLLPLALHTGQKYYLIELYISKILVEKVSENWKLLINIQNQNFNVNKVLRLTIRSPLIEVIPVDENVIDCEVYVKLFRQTEQNCLTMHLSKVNIDVSYHFESYQDIHTLPTCQEKIVNLTKLYNTMDNINHIFKPVYVEYKINSSMSPQEFVKYFLRNSYHRLDIELFSELTSSASKPLNIAFTFRNYSRCIIMYDPQLKTIKLKCTAEDMYILKDYIFKSIPTVNYDYGIPNLPSTETRAQLSQDTCSLEELRKSYEGYRKLVHKMDL